MEILAFIESLDDPHLLGRQLEDYRHGAENGLLLVLRLPQGQIIAASGVFEIRVNKKDGSGLSIELDHFILRSAPMLMALAQVCGKTELWGLPVDL